MKRPVMKFILPFSDAIGWRLLPNSISAPDPRATMLRVNAIAHE